LRLNDERFARIERDREGTVKTNAGLLKTQDGRKGARPLFREAPVSALLATWFGVGLLPFASGTWASLATIPVVDALYGTTGLYGVIVFCLLTGALGIPVSGRVAKVLKKGDPSQVVVDEVAGQALALLAVYTFCPFPRTSLAFWAWVGIAFVLFRVLDIYKPGPIGWMERLPGGLGIMMDDLLAGFLEGLVLAATLLLLYRR
jgi:phosphatidylglycerophosphatase A